MRLTPLFLALGSLLLAGQHSDWHYSKVDPQTKKHIVTIDAKAFEATQDPSVFLLRDVTARVYAANGSTYRLLSSSNALLNNKLGTMTYGPNLSKVLKLK